MLCVGEGELRAEGAEALEDFVAVVENGFGEGIPEVVAVGEFGKGDEFTIAGFFDMGDFGQGFDFGDKDVGPSNFVIGTHSVATEVRGAAEDGPGFLACFADGGALAAFAGFDASAGDAPASVADFGDEDEVTLPGKDKGGESSMWGAIGGGKELHELVSELSAGESHDQSFLARAVWSADGNPSRIMMTFPRMSPLGTAPQARESSLTGRLSPRT